MSGFLYSDDNKRYHTLHYYSKHHGGKCYKAVIDAGFTCPNIDGTKGVGGCTYCDGGSGYFTNSCTVPIEEQLKREISRIREKHQDVGIIAYFQAHSNTYASLDLLKRTFSKALENPDVCGISIATRADCLDEDKVKYLKELSEKTNLTVELGLQTVSDETAEQINRGHSFDEFLQGYNLLKKYNIRTCVHIINGLPNEDYNMMINTAKVVGKLSPGGVKIHLLHIIKGTKMAREFENGEIKVMSRDDYVKTVVEQLRYLPPQTVIERITGDGDKSKLIAPLWSRDKIAVLGAIDKYMADNDIYQGDKI
ncbi:MAG: TIGR01212 family radical SAM protein [Clostridia bacterium]|nr:TIGR01212 family radical SAM protein [Clostridia bacterium]